MTDPLHLLSVGEFGNSVAQRLKTLRTDVVHTSVDEAAIPVDWPAARIRVIASWRPVLRLSEAVDEISHQKNLPFIPLVMDGRVLSLGPVVTPGSGSCWGCWFRRSRQHGSWVARRAAVAEYYQNNPQAGPRGYLEPFAWIGAARISQTVDTLDSGGAVGGRVWQIDMFTRRISTGTAVGVHGCPRCGLHRREDRRGFADMRQALSSFWTE